MINVVCRCHPHRRRQVPPLQLLLPRKICFNRNTTNDVEGLASLLNVTTVYINYTNLNPRTQRRRVTNVLSTELVHSRVNSRILWCKRMFFLIGFAACWLLVVVSIIPSFCCGLTCNATACVLPTKDFSTFMINKESY